MRLLARLSRTLVSVPGTSSQSFAHSRNFSSQQSERNNKDEEFAKSMNSLLPSENFKKSLNDQQTKLLERILPEIELFAYMSDRVPRALNDENWTRLLEHPTVRERVGFLEHLALKARRDENDKSRKNTKSEEHRKWLDEQRAKYERGEMGYGPDMYTLLFNPMRIQKRINLVEGSRALAAARMDNPRIIFDMESMLGESKRNQSVIGTQMMYAITENFETRPPLQFAFANLPKNEKDKLWIKKVIGHYTGQYTHQMVMPEFSEKSVKAVAKGIGAKDIVYLSRYASEYLDGPLTADAYIICASMDYKKESLGAARRANIPVRKIPIQKYVKWESGPMYLPLNNIARILRQVYSNGGDWKTALYNNIAKRHLMTAEERESQQSQVSRHKLRSQNKLELIQSLQNATGNL